MANKRPFRWRRLNNAIHRDVGYLVAAMTIIYAISGVAVNHIHQWNPNYSIERERVSFAPVEVTDKDAMAAAVTERLGIELPLSDAYRPSPESINLFFDGVTVEADAVEGTAIVERAVDRPILRDANFLHLNHAKGLWTWIADLYAVMLATLAITGMFILKGRKGFGGRGKWLFGIGLVVPLVALAVYRWFG
jgi:hypothetical protein